MHTVLTLDRGVLETSLVAEEETYVARSRWRAAIAPAISFLRSLGGGTTCVFHRPGELLP